MRASDAYVAESAAEHGPKAWMALVPAVLSSVAGSGDLAWPPQVVQVRRGADGDIIWIDADGLAPGVAAQRVTRLNDALDEVELTVFEAQLAEGRAFDSSS